ncbi:hypothetical protein L1F30_03430 [Simiduia sp. 21SJ11W-1]|uniref:hypothetical protein n=1 Tax=Simiduia sp. 21SJ11W-1 TaxID=2909669 RepID=UPI00209F1D6A|nr:hypothetical protein [Simiduia sp. 21SJ11W-1]UTA48602.1 hypothetical protein L1F30_03430 [Simiduia sp. 21SJ11W-1]
MTNLAAAQEQVWLYDTKLADAKVAIAEQQADFISSAHAHYQKALALETHSPVALRGLGLLHLDQQEPAQAKEFFTQYLQLNDIKDRRYIESLVKKI